MRALITGVTGQDGSYLAEHLHAKGHEVFGLLRGQDHPRDSWITNLVPGITLLSGDLLDESSLRIAVGDCDPDWVFNLAAVASPTQAWRQPVLTGEVTGLGALRLFEVVRTVAPRARVIQASSLANHGPYGAAKLFAHAVAQDYRQRGLHISCAIFGGHHSPRRGKSYFSRKVTSTVAAIARGDADRLELGSLTRMQDWGCAPDFMEQLPVMAELDPGDYVVSTGDPHSSQEWVMRAFACVGLDWREFVQTNESLGNVTDVAVMSGDPDPRLNWTPDRDFAGLVRWMVESEEA
jgi:GDPmannose 4,6-dehydratase